ncbi:SurA N-terminal domain-containing protein [Massilia pseudoviolaceinigra]|uniref:SurA N-terminal domain-containing protein n=1 Tax=Massilia pseudoviolaceinigra TaxID=3057165 RepID=UPI002796C0C7|nr:SurA N-terminal domain-containing protein [Massilia sp. CCM 9206]MDQ1921995.1 SurA N-terminal domain-containing protein [Massilia sp. CCM 9206]
MFEFIRNHKRWIQVMLVLLAASFLVVGGMATNENTDSTIEVANVNGKKITQPEWEDAQRKQIDRYRAMMGAQFDQKRFDTPEFKREILNNLVAQRAVETEIDRSHLTVGDDVLVNTIQQDENFHTNGKFDVEVYKAALNNARMTAPQYEDSLRRSFALQQLTGTVQETAFVPRAIASRLSDMFDQEREVQEMLFPAKEQQAQVKVTDEMVKAFYDKNAALFQIPEKVKIEYIMFDAAAVEGLVSVTDAEVSEFYKSNVKRYTTPEDRQYSHIMFTVAKGASAADKAAAKAKADAVLAELRKAPESFAEVAKAKSQDVATAEQGGDLGQAKKGEFLSAALEPAVFKLKQGEISDVVESESGYHILTVTKLVPEVVKPFDEVKDAIVAEVKKPKMSKKYSELAQVFSETVYDQSDSLKPAADKLKLKIETIDNLSRTPNPALGNAPFNNVKFLNAVFSDSVLKNKHNTDAIQATPSTLIAARVLEYKPATKRPLAEVDTVIRARVAEQEAANLAKKAGEAKIAAAKTSGDAAGFGEAKVVSRAAPTGINPTALTAVLKADTSKLPAYVGVDLPGIGYGVYRIGKVAQAAKPDVARRAAEQQDIAQRIGQAEMHNYIDALKQKAKAKVTVKTEVAAADTPAVPAVK